MTAKMTNKLGLCVSAIARKFGYVSQKKAALGFAEGWYMHNERAAACWQSVEEAFANSELQDLLPELNFTNGDLAQFYFDSLSPVEKLSFIKCREQKEGFVLVPVEPTQDQIQAGLEEVRESWDNNPIPESTNFTWGDMVATYKAMIKAAQEDE